MEDRAFQEMKKAAIKHLEKQDPHVVSALSGCIYNDKKQVFEIETLGKSIEISYPEGESSISLENWHHLIMLHYLYMADGTENTGQWITFGDLKDGLIRGTKFDQTVETELRTFLKGKTPEEVLDICSKLGARQVAGKADLSVRIPFLPNYPVLLNIWFEDEEFPPSAKMLVDQTADHYLSVEDAVTVGSLLLERIIKSSRKIQAIKNLF